MLKTGFGYLLNDLCEQGRTNALSPVQRVHIHLGKQRRTGNSLPKGIAHGNLRGIHSYQQTALIHSLQQNLAENTFRQNMFGEVSRGKDGARCRFYGV